jgi:succinate-acetate transporter protein
MVYSGEYIGDPSPLGLLCFGITTCLLMFEVTGWSESSFNIVVMAFAVCYGGIVQMVAGIFEFLKGNTFAGTAFLTYGAFWMSYFVTSFLEKTNPSTFSGSFSVGKTLYLCLWGVLSFGLFIPTLRKNVCLMFTFGTLTATFFLLAGGVWNGHVHIAAGYLGFVCGCSALYTAFAILYQETLGIKVPGMQPVKVRQVTNENP